MEQVEASAEGSQHQSVGNAGGGSPLLRVNSTGGRLDSDPSPLLRQSSLRSRFDLRRPGSKAVVKK